MEANASCRHNYAAGSPGVSIGRDGLSKNIASQQLLHSEENQTPRGAPATNTAQQILYPAVSLHHATYPTNGMQQISYTSPPVTYPGETQVLTDNAYTSPQIPYPTTSCHHASYPANGMQQSSSTSSTATYPGETETQMPTNNYHTTHQRQALRTGVTEPPQNSAPEANIILQGFETIQSTLAQLSSDIKNLVVHNSKGEEKGTVHPPPITPTPTMMGDLHLTSPSVYATVDFNRVSCPTPPLNLQDISQSLRDFEAFCKMSAVPIAHQRRLLLEELRQKAPHVLTEFVRAHETDPSYDALKSFLQGRFESVSAIHHLIVDPPFMNSDAYSQFSKAVDLYKKTSPEEFVKFIVLRTSPPELQKAMATSLNLPYNRFFDKYKHKLEVLQSNTNTHPSQENRQPPRTPIRPLENPQMTQRRETTVPTNHTRQQPTNRERHILCRYHFQFGHKARNCDLPDCSMKHLVPAAIQPFRNTSKNEPGQ